MIAQIKLFPDQASTMATRVDAIYFVLLAFSGFFIVLIASLILRFAVKYRRRSEKDVPPEIKSSTMLELAWALPPLLIALGIYYWGAQVFYDSTQPPSDSMETYVVAKQWMWHVQHAGGQREINAMHVPIGKPVKLTMISQDVIHNFSVPAFRVRQDVLPGRYTTMWFTPTKQGKFRIFCAEYCGTNHSRMVGWIHVMSVSQFQDWLAAESDNSLATQGRKLFLKLQCVTCHHRQGAAPLLEEIWDKDIPLQNSSKIHVDEAYLRESILNPDAKIVAGHKAIMPSYKGQVTESEMFELITFIRSLKAGESPDRNERTDPPSVAPPREKD